VVLLLVRHGATDANERGLLLGRADPELSARGLAQAREMAAWLPHAELVVSSPLRRARQTAALLSADVTIDDRWTELDYGPYDGSAPDSVPADVWARWRADPTDAPNGVEPLAALGARVRAACAELSPIAEAGLVVVVTHVSPIKAALAWALGVGDEISWSLFVEDASVSRIDVQASGPVVRWFNRVGHDPAEHREETGGGVAPAGQLTTASPGGGGEPRAKGPVGGEGSHGAGQAGDVAG
jgi:broad specificity phosphatase PhoE